MISPIVNVVEILHLLALGAFTLLASMYFRNFDLRTIDLFSVFISFQPDRRHEKQKQFLLVQK